MSFSNLKNKITSMTKKQKIFYIVISLFIILNIVLASVVISVYNSRSSVQLEIYGTTEMSRLKAVNKWGRKGEIKNQEDLIYQKVYARAAWVKGY